MSMLQLSKAKVCVQIIFMCSKAAFTCSNFCKLGLECTLMHLQARSQDFLKGGYMDV